MLDVARINLEKAYKQAEAKRGPGRVRPARPRYSVYQQELEKLREIEEQIRECKIDAPQDGMVVYYKESSSRFSSNQRGDDPAGGAGEGGAEADAHPGPEPDAGQHQGPRGDGLPHPRRRPPVRPGSSRACGPGCWPTPTRSPGSCRQSEHALNALREQYRDQEYVPGRAGPAGAASGWTPSRTGCSTGTSGSVAAVASQQDWSSSRRQGVPDAGDRSTRRSRG